MKSTLVWIITLGLAASSAFAQLQINTPASAVVCEPLLITWSGGTPPYFLSIFPGNQPGAAALLNFPETNATSVTWNVDIAAQTSLGLQVRDVSGTIAQSAAYSVQAGPSSSCVGSSSITFGTTATSGATPTGQSSSVTGTTPVTTSPSTPNTGSSPASTAAKSSAGTPTTSASATPKSGASRVTGQIAAAGIIGAAIAAILG